MRLFTNTTERERYVSTSKANASKPKKKVELKWRSTVEFKMMVCHNLKQKKKRKEN